MNIEQINSSITNLSAAYSTLNEQWQHDTLEINELQLIRQERYSDFYNSYKDFNIEALLTGIITFRISQIITNRLSSLINNNIELFNQKKEHFTNFNTYQLFELSEQKLFGNKLEVLKKDLEEIKAFEHTTKREKRILIEETTATIQKLQSEQSGYFYTAGWVRQNFYKEIYILSQNFISVIDSYFPKEATHYPTSSTSKQPKKTKQLIPNIKEDAIYINMKLASSIHELCNDVQFEPIPENDFYNLLNNQSTNAKLIIKPGEKTRVYFLIHRLSNYMKDANKRKNWMDYVFRLLDINEANYNSKYREPISKHPSKASQKFAGELDQIFQ